MAKSKTYRAVEELIRSLGLSCSNLSIRQLIYGVELYHYDPAVLDHVTKRLYPTIAEHYPDANGKSVERNLRTARSMVLERSDPERLCQVLGTRIRYGLSVGDLIDLLAWYMDREYLWPIE